MEAALRRRGAVAALALCALLAACGGAAGEAGDVHLVRLVASGDEYAFEPNEVHARPGDVLRFVHTGYQPESVVFDGAAAPAGAAGFLRSQRLLDGILLTRPGQVYEVSLDGAPPGRYPFLSVPHAAAGMRGVLVVESADEE